MAILFDLQNHLEKAKPDTEFKSDILQPYGDFPPTLQVLEESGVKCISVLGRERKTSGILLKLSDLPNINLGYRILITGRIDKTAPKEGWGITLAGNLDDATGQLDQVLKPNGIYRLSYLFTEEDYKSELYLYINSWKNYLPTMNFTIDNVLIGSFASSKKDIKDGRVLVYSMEEQSEIQNSEIGSILPEDLGDLRRSGLPTLFVDEYNGSRVLRIDNRERDYDGIDIMIENLDLLPDDEYILKVTGRLEGEAPEGTQITFQKIPGFNWRSTKLVQANEEFEIIYKINKLNISKLTQIRLTTNPLGARAVIFVHSIEITVDK